MDKSNLYIRGSMVVDETHYIAVVRLLKVLYRLEIIDEDTAMNIIMEFKPFFV